MHYQAQLVFKEKSNNFVVGRKLSSMMWYDSWSQFLAVVVEVGGGGSFVVLPLGKLVKQYQKYV